MATRKMKVIRGKRIRVTKLGTCGEPPDVYESCALVVSKGFVQVALTAEVETGTELTQQNADGELIVNDQSRHSFKRWTGTIEFAEVDPELISLLTKVTLETDAAGDVVGYRSVEGLIENNFALEVWSGLADQDCSEGEEFGYFLLPFVGGGTVGNITIENGVSTFNIENMFTRSGGEWGIGPYDVVPDVAGDPAPLSVAIQDGEHHVQRPTTVPPPDPTDGCVALL